MRFPEMILRLPDWVERFLSEREYVFATVQERMRLVIELSRLNIENGTGGPFGAAIFEQKSGRLLAVGVNMVVSSNCSVVHAEIVSIAIAQHILGHYDLGSKGMPAYELAASTEPCAMCLGAITWSGVRGLVCGGRDQDARDVGFDEGLKPSNWVRLLEQRNISVSRDILRNEAKAVLLQYHEQGGPVYNGRQGSI
ncbi:MAG: nucleoside deaminase [Planctomycetota bacterium]|nr:MAG: nucleoside deaminase [Planctomycetota bacterium]